MQCMKPGYLPGRRAQCVYCTEKAIEFLGCEERGLDPERARIDLVSLDLGAGGRVAHVEHFRGLEIPDEPDG